MIDALLAELDGPERLAILHAPRDLRSYLTALLVLDRRLAAIMRKTSEPIIAQMRFAWWRDRLGGALDGWPKGEPFFAALAQIGDDAQQQHIAENLKQLVDIWEELAIAPDWSHDVMMAFHDARAELFFLELAGHCGILDPYGAILNKGREWSAYDLISQLPGEERHVSRPSKPMEKSKERLPRQLRSLVILHRSAILGWQNQQGQGRSAFYSSLRLFLSSAIGR